MGSMSVGTDWAKDRWVLIYLFSSVSDNLHGYGTYVAKFGQEYFESSTASTFSMIPYQGSHHFRFGSRNGGTS